jgi:hypothetical protein
MRLGVPPIPMQRPTRWLAPNRYEGTCVRCLKVVEIGSGEYRHDGIQWIVRHHPGACHSVGYSTYVSEHAPAWERVRAARMEFAGHRCEWRNLIAGRCRVVAPLQCHHRHYRTFGRERLKDVIILCHEHHEIADNRRRQWGTWPLFGRPFSGSWRPGDDPRPDSPTGPDGTPPNLREERRIGPP